VGSITADDLTERERDIRRWGFSSGGLELTDGQTRT
jgi:hypothetical protein